MTTVYLDDDQMDRVSTHAKRMRVPKAVLIRAGIDVLLWHLDNGVPLWDDQGNVITEHLEAAKETIEAAADRSTAV